jgi:hypothetical protein
MSVTSIDLNANEIGDEGAAALIDALEVNTTLISGYFLNDNAIDESNRASVKALVYALSVRNCHFRSLFLFDARQMLLLLMCADEYGVVWPYCLTSTIRMQAWSCTAM